MRTLSEVDAYLRVEEIPVAVHVEVCRSLGIPVPVVGGSFYGIVYVAVLQVCESGERAGYVVIGADVCVRVEFLAGVVVIFLQRVDGADIIAHPVDLSVMMAVKLVGCDTEGGVPFSMAVVQGCHSSAEIVDVMLEPYQVGFLHKLSLGCQEWLQPVFHECASCFVLLVIAVVFRVMERHVEAPPVAECLRQEQLEVMLYVVVVLVRIVGSLAVVGGVFSAGIVSSAVFLHFLL